MKHFSIGALLPNTYRGMGLNFVKLKKSMVIDDGEIDFLHIEP
ncbi:hypothetical protein FM107_13585 [Sphingobacterium sp. JB170]|nr:hypothetical protein FM107_13585 [Sphingobacterium sp. JB170]